MLLVYYFITQLECYLYGKHTCDTKVSHGKASPNPVAAAVTLIVWKINALDKLCGLVNHCSYCISKKNVVHNTYLPAEVLIEADVQLRPWRSPLAQCSPYVHKTLSPQRKGGNSGTDTQAKNTNKEIFSTKWRWKSWSHMDCGY